MWTSEVSYAVFDYVKITIGASFCVYVRMMCSLSVLKVDTAFIQWAHIYPTTSVPHKMCQINQVLDK